LDALLARLEALGRRSVPKLKSHAKPLRVFFSMKRAAHVTADDVVKFQQDRLAAGRANATVNRELELLRQAYRRAVRDKKLSPDRVPAIDFLPVHNVRQGFFEAEEVSAVVEHLEPALADFVCWSAATGMRKGESSQLLWRMLDRSGPKWQLRIPAAIVKNKLGRTLPVVGTARDIIERRLKARQLGCDLIFHRVSKGKTGQPIKAFDRAWRNALKEAGIPRDRIVHDLRRSAARDLIRSGARESEAMLVTGHRTRSMFDRYNITTDEEAATAMERRDQFAAKRLAKA
jgi:integrase